MKKKKQRFAITDIVGGVIIGIIYADSLNEARKMFSEDYKGQKLLSLTKLTL